jgi:hypothetical protein
VNSPATETLTIGQGSITISEPAIAAGSGTATIATPDPYEVVPVDPLSATAAALGPALDTSSSPPVSRVLRHRRHKQRHRRHTRRLRLRPHILAGPCSPLWRYGYRHL